jgi:hypothetical protein
VITNDSKKIEKEIQSFDITPTRKAFLAQQVGQERIGVFKCDVEGRDKQT